MKLSLLALSAAAAVMAASPGSASQPATGGTPAIDPDATCLMVVVKTVAGPGRDPAFMGENHDQAIAAFQGAGIFYSARLALHHDGPALDAALLAADRALPADRWDDLAVQCMRQYASDIPRLTRELEQALEAAGIPRGGPEPPPTPADAATLDPDLRCIAAFLQGRQGIIQRGAAAPTSMTRLLPLFADGIVFYSSRALLRLPATTRGTLLASTLRSLRTDQAEHVAMQCAGLMNSDMGRIGMAASSARAQEQPVHPH